MTKIGILVVAYNAASTLAQTLDRIPADFVSDIHEVLVGDDHSQDSTHLVALGYQQMSTDLPLTIVRHPENLGYGGNQKWGYRYAVEHGLGRRRAAPRRRAVRPRAAPRHHRADPRGPGRGGVRLAHHEPRRGPAGRDAGLQVRRQPHPHHLPERVVGTDLTEWHSGYRAYDVRRWPSCRSSENVDGFNFDTEIIIQLHEAGFRIREIPIPTYYGDEICYVDGMKYAKDVTQGRPAVPGPQDGLRHRREGVRRRRLRHQGRPDIVARPHPAVDGAATAVPGARPRLLRRRAGRPPPGAGPRGRRRRRRGAQGGPRAARRLLPGRPRARDARTSSAATSTSWWRPTCSSTCGSPKRCSTRCGTASGRAGSVITSIPNFGHWYPRTAGGARPVRLRRTRHPRPGPPALLHPAQLRRMVAASGWEIRRQESIGLPLEVADRGARRRRRRASARPRRQGRSSRGGRSGRSCSPTSSSTSWRRSEPRRARPRAGAPRTRLVRSGSGSSVPVNASSRAGIADGVDAEVDGGVVGPGSELS